MRLFEIRFGSSDGTWVDVSCVSRRRIVFKDSQSTGGGTRATRMFLNRRILQLVTALLGVGLSITTSNQGLHHGKVGHVVVFSRLEKKLS